MTQTDNIVNFLKSDGSTLCISKIEREAKMPPRTLQYAIGLYRQIPAKHLPDLIRILSAKGYVPLNPVPLTTSHSLLPSLFPIQDA